MQGLPEHPPSGFREGRLSEVNDVFRKNVSLKHRWRRPRGRRATMDQKGSAPREKSGPVLQGTADHAYTLGSNVSGPWLPG